MGICPGIIAGQLDSKSMQISQQVVLNEGDPNCKHEYIYYLQNDFDGQDWTCDICRRNEKMSYNPGVKMAFPPIAYIRTPNSQFGGEQVYSHKTDAQGLSSILPENDRVPKKTLESKLGK